MSSQSPGSNPVVVVMMEVVVILSQSMEPTVHLSSKCDGVHISWHEQHFSFSPGLILKVPFLKQKQTIPHMKA